jgi:hypothetical protein
MRQKNRETSFLNRDAPIFIACYYGKTKLIIPNNEFSNTSTNEDFRLIEINWNSRKDFINLLDITGFLYSCMKIKCLIKKIVIHKIRLS